MKHFIIDFFKSLFIIVFSLLLIACSGGGSSSPNSASAPASNFELRPAAISLSWNIPTERQSGASLPISDIAGYELVIEDSQGVRQHHTIDDPLQNSFVTKVLEPDDYQINVFTYDRDNRVSLPSTTYLLRKSEFQNP